MKALPQFSPYPLNARPAYLRWFTVGAALFCLAGLAGVQLASVVEPRHAVGAVVVVMTSWLLALLLRMLFHEANRANAERYTHFGQMAQQQWWQEHRQHVSLIDAVLISPACSAVEKASALFAFTYMPALNALRRSVSFRTSWVSGTGREKRELQLARCLAMRWHERSPEVDAAQLVRCYWLGSPAAWQAFSAQVLELMPQVRLPAQPEPWQGIESLNGVIDELQSAPQQARILCAACASVDDSPHAGEAALLWLLGAQGGPRIHRGEWLGSGAQSMSEMAKRALLQSEMEEPAQACMSFSVPALPQSELTDWDAAKYLQDAHFGALGGLEPMVALTLACWYAKCEGVPCAWLASDPKQTVALGVVKPDEAV